MEVVQVGGFEGFGLEGGVVVDFGRGRFELADFLDHFVFFFQLTVYEIGVYVGQLVVDHFVDSLQQRVKLLLVCLNLHGLFRKEMDQLLKLNVQFILVELPFQVCKEGAPV